jgi:hypothetical protein
MIAYDFHPEVAIDPRRGSDVQERLRRAHSIIQREIERFLVPSNAADGNRVSKFAAIEVLHESFAVNTGLPASSAP